MSMLRASRVSARPLSGRGASRCYVRPSRPVPSFLRPKSSARNDPQQQQNDERDQLMAGVSLGASLLGGFAMGMGLGPLDEALEVAGPAVQHLSAGLGWSYFLAWSISFYPQVYDNWRRKSVTGLSADYLVYSILGYSAYTAYTAALYFSPGVQAAYMAAHGGSAPDVQLTDFAFAAHALLVSLFTLYQCFLYGAPSESVDEQQQGQQGQQQPRSLLSSGLGTSRPCELTSLAVAAAVAAFSGHIGTTCGISDCHAWLPMLYLLGATKVTMTLIKYTPQALLNHSRRSTDGWQINNVLLDLAGGLLSFAQIGVNAVARSDMSVVTGNPAKLGISLISVAFDIVFILQHYVLYRGGSSSSSLEAATAAAAAAAEAAADNEGLAGVLVPVPAEVAVRQRQRRRVAVNATGVGAAPAGGQAQLVPSRRRSSSTQ